MLSLYIHEKTWEKIYNLIFLFFRIKLDHSMKELFLKQLRFTISHLFNKYFPNIMGNLEYIFRFLWMRYSKNGNSMNLESFNIFLCVKPFWLFIYSIRSWGTMVWIEMVGIDFLDIIYIDLVWYQYHRYMKTILKTRLQVKDFFNTIFICKILLNLWLNLLTCWICK